MNPERPSNVSKNTNKNQSCAACKFQRRKCPADCPLAPYFPAENQQDFDHVRRLFGVANVLKITKNLDPIQKADAMRSIIYESTVHAMDPVFGCRAITAHLQSQIARGVAEINDVRQQLVQLRMAAHQQQQRQQQQQQQQYVTMGYDQPMMPQKQPLEGVPMGYDGSIERERSSAAMGRPRNAQEDQNHGVLETEQIVELHMTAQQQQQQQQQQQYVTMGCDQQMMLQHQQQPLEFLKEMGCDQQMMQQQQQQQPQYVTMGCDQQMMPQHQQQPLEFLKEMGCDQQMMQQQQQQQQQYVTMGCDQQMMPQHQQQPLEFLKEMGCDQQMMQQQQQQQQYVTMGCDQQMMPQQQQQQPPLEGVTMGRPRSAQEDQNHGVLETEPQNGF